jgi:exopolysaccharide biosynthesis protein
VFAIEDLFPFDDDHFEKRTLSVSIDDYETLKYTYVDVSEPITTRIMMNLFNGQHTPVHVTWLENPVKYFSVVEPGVNGGCASSSPRKRVSVTSRLNGCSIASNAGFFNTRTGKCIGNLITNAKQIQITGFQNSNFGITADGEIYTGYLSRQTILNNTFTNLVTGVIWLVRARKNFVDQSFILEDMSVQETGRDFITVKSARSAIGHDSMGRIVLVNIQGKSWERGVDLYQFADFLIQLGIVNAINLDGGGSMTSVRDSVLVSAPSDPCGFDPQFKCEREVTTAICFKGNIRDEQ